jgi:hypothetical protein
MTKQKNNKSFTLDNLKKFTKQQTKDTDTLLQKKKILKKLSSGNFITKYYNASLNSILDELIYCVKTIQKELETNLYPTDAKKKKDIYLLFLKMNFIDIILKCRQYEIKGRDKILVSKMMKEVRQFFEVFQNLNKDLHSNSKITKKDDDSSSEVLIQLHKEKNKK